MLDLCPKASRSYKAKLKKQQQHVILLLNTWQYYT